MKTVLFQGDSITDANRDREGLNQDNILGLGYVRLLAARILDFILQLLRLAGLERRFMLLLILAALTLQLKPLSSSSRQRTGMTTAL